MTGVETPAIRHYDDPFRAERAPFVWLAEREVLRFLNIWQYSIAGPVLSTILFVVVTINAINFIDGLDGLAAGVVAIASLSFFAYSYELSVVHHFDRATAPTG